MLKPDEILEATQQAEKAAGTCTRFCRVVGELSDDERYRFSHNGIGSRDSDMQVVYATATLNMIKDPLTARLTAWIAGLHSGLRVDLNEG